MRFVGPASLGVLLLLLLMGCTGRTESTSGSGHGTRPLSARFSERTVHGTGADRWEESSRGAFDWTERRGWASKESRGSSLSSARPSESLAGQERTIQIGDRCYRRTGNDQWREFLPDGLEGLCNIALFASPTDQAALLQRVGEIEIVGRDTIRGAPTTHYRGRLNVGAVRESFELWVDDEQRTRRLIRRSLKSQETGGFVSVRNYFDFGVDVEIKAPVRKGSK